MFWKKPEPDEGERLVAVMRLRKASLPEPLPPGEAHDFQEAKRRCRACNAKELCDELIAAGAADDFALFCPNCHYIQRVRDSSLSFR
jgi:late competence protein required for DNA uptake (superfamily II DNA/RNA helicase)